jgi:hypothetical protein
MASVDRSIMGSRSPAGGQAPPAGGAGSHHQPQQAPVSAISTRPCQLTPSAS